MIDQRKGMQLLTSELLEASSVTDLVGSRIHGGWARNTDLETIPKPAVVFTYSSGAVHYYGVTGQYSVEMYCLSANSQDEAQKVHDAVFAVLQGTCLDLPNFDHRGWPRLIDTPRAGWLDGAAVWWVHSRWAYRLIEVIP